jgi:hypothetical protein
MGFEYMQEIPRPRDILAAMPREGRLADIKKKRGSADQ